MVPFILSQLRNVVKVKIEAFECGAEVMVLAEAKNGKSRWFAAKITAVAATYDVTFDHSGDVSYSDDWRLLLCSETVTMKLQGMEACLME